MEWEAAAFPELFCLFSLFFSLFFSSNSLFLSLHNLNQAYKLRLYLDTQKYISSPNSLYWELQVLVSNLQGISSFLCAKWNPQQWSTTPLLALSGITAHSFLNPKRRFFFSLDLLFSLTSTLYSLWWEGLTILLQNIHQIHSSQENGSLSIGLFYINFMTKLLLLSSF